MCCKTRAGQPVAGRPPPPPALFPAEVFREDVLSPRSSRLYLSCRRPCMPGPGRDGRTACGQSTRLFTGSVAAPSCVTAAATTSASAPAQPRPGSTSSPSTPRVQLTGNILSATAGSSSNVSSATAGSVRDASCSRTAAGRGAASAGGRHPVRGRTQRHRPPTGHPPLRFLRRISPALMLSSVTRWPCIPAWSRPRRPPASRLRSPICWQPATCWPNHPENGGTICSRR